MRYIFLADIVLIIHFLYVLFVVIGLFLIWVGIYMRWKWVKNFWFRIIHLASMVFVVIISIFGIPCPLTILERNLRLFGGKDFYVQSFVQHWVHKVLFYSAPDEVFTAIYIVFAMLAGGTFYFVPIRFSKRGKTY